MGVRQTKFLVGRVLHLVSILLILTTMLLAITGCGSPTGNGIKEIRTIERPISNTIELYEDRPYDVQETQVVGEDCIERHYSELNNSKLTIIHEEKEWVRQPPVPGETNNLRRVALIHNGLDEIDAIYLDKIWLYDGKETKRSKHPLMFLIDPQSTRKLYVMWDTQYDPLKDTMVVFSNNTEEIGYETRIMRMCINETEEVTVTKYKQEKTGEVEQIEGYDVVTRVDLY
jgi:hypothetical protein